MTGTVAVGLRLCTKWEGGAVVELAVALEVGALSVHKKKGGKKRADWK